VDLEDPDIGKSQARLAQGSRDGEGRSEEQFLHEVLAGIGIGREECLGLQAEIFCLVLAHDEHRGAAIGQE